MRPLITRTLLSLLSSAGLMVSGHAQSSPPTQVYYIPFPEDNQLAAFETITTDAGGPLAVFVTFTAATDNTIIYYDHWEDGYEEDITRPAQSTTQIFGDGNPANGAPPGNPADIISAGTVFNLRNFVDTSTLGQVLDYDARDKVASFKPIALTKTTFPTGTNTLLAGCFEVFEQGLWGTDYRAPVGQNMPTDTPASPLTNDEEMFAYTTLSVMAGEAGATIQIDADNNGTFEQTVTLGQGQPHYVTGVSVGGRVRSVDTRPIQVELFTGRPGSNYQSRDTTLLPVNRWSSNYYAPVSTRSTTSDTQYNTVVFLYNPGTTAITVNYDYKNASNNALVNATVSVPAGGNARALLAPASTTNYGAYRFYTSNNATFYAISTIDANDTDADNNDAFDGGFTLIGQPSLSTQILVSLGIGRDPYSTASPTQNGNPIWLTTVGNGNTPETVYVDYNGDNSGPNVDANGNRYDVSYNLVELQQQKLFDPDGDQTGMFVYTLNANVKIAAAYGQDPTIASAAQPGVDVATVVPPLREGDAGKSSSVAVDADGDGEHSAGDTLEYDIRVINTARSPIPGPFTVNDTFPADTVYVANSTRFRVSIGGVWQPWQAVADDGAGTPFPLDGAGYAVPVPAGLGVGQQIQITFQATIDTYGNLDSGRSQIVNSGTVEITPYGVVVPLYWADNLYGSIGDRLWVDADGDGTQDAGEAGLNGVGVFLDLDNDGTMDAGEPSTTTAGDGNYVFTGLLAGTYTVRVDPASLAAINPGYGPTYDLDGIATSYVASATLLSAQDRVDVDFGFRIDASVGDRVWLDRNGNDTQESGEPGINGVRVYVDTDNDNAYDVGEPNSITFGDGDYYIGNLPPNTTYNIRVDTTTLPANLTQTYDLNGSQTDNEAAAAVAFDHLDTVDFGYQGNLSIGDLVWYDTDANGANVNIIDGRVDINASGTVDNNDDGFIGTMRVVNGYLDIDNDASTTTPDGGDDGTFQGFTVINGGIDYNGDGSIAATDDGNRLFIPDYTIIAGRVDINGSGGVDNNDDGFIGTMRVVNGYIDIDNDASTTTPDADDDGIFRGIPVVNGGLDTSLNNSVGAEDVGTIPTEKPISGVRVYIDANNSGTFDGNEAFATTDATGGYSITGLYSGTFVVRVDTTTLPSSYKQTYDLTSPINDHSATVTLAGSSTTLVDFGYRDDATIGDYVWNDLDGDGVQEPGEPPMAGILVYLDSTNNNVFDYATERYAVTDANGYYLIDNLASGTYEVRVEIGTLPASVTQTYDLDTPATSANAANRTLTGSENATNVDFGYRSTASLGDRVWSDTDGDGVQDGGESGINNVRVYVDLNNNGNYDASTEPSAITAGDGAYAITGFIPGTYLVRVDPGTLPGGVVQTYDLNGVLDGAAIASLVSNQVRTDVDFGYVVPASIGDFVWNDTDGDGQQDIGETGISGVGVTLYRASDDSVAATTTTSGTGAYSFTNLIPGTYYAIFDAVPGKARTVLDQGVDASDSDANTATGRTANITVAAGQTNNTIDAGYTDPAAIGDFVWNDTNGNGVQDGGESGLAGVVVSLFRPGIGPDGIAGNGDDATAVGSMTTSGSGAYSFSGLTPGTYEVEFSALAGYSRVTRDVGANDLADSDASVATGRTGSIVLTAGQNNTSVDAGYSQPVSIGNFVWNDANANGIQDGGEAGLGGVLVTLFRPGIGADGIPGNADDALAVATTTSTAVTGAYLFSGLPAGTYQLSFGTLAGYNRTLADQGGNDAVDSDANATTGLTSTVTLLPGTTDDTLDAGYFQPSAIGNLVWNDLDADGVQDGGTEVGLNGVTVNLFRPGFGADGIAGTTDDANAVATTTTAGGGIYSFTGLRPGTYEVEFGTLAGYNRTLANQGTDAADSDASATTGRTGSVVLAANTTDNTVDAGLYQPVSIGDFVWEDLDWDGQQDGGEPGLDGVVINLYRPGFGPDGIAATTGDNADVVATTTSSGGGAYAFTGLPPGTYQVEFTNLSGFTRTVALTGATATDSDANATTGLTGNVVLAAAGSNITIDAGYRHVERVGDRVWNDVNGNGIQDSGEPGIPGVDLQVYTAAGAPYEFRTNYGNFSDNFDPAGGLTGSDGSLAWATNWTATAGASVVVNTGTDYEIRIADTALSTITRSFVAPAGTAQVTISFDYRQGTGNDTVRAQFSEDNTNWTDLGSAFVTGSSGTGSITPIVVATTPGTRYFRFRKTAQGGGGGSTEYIYFDNVNIVAESALNTAITTTDANGNYYFDSSAGLVSSTNYQIRLATNQLPLAGFSLSPQDQGGNDATDSDGSTAIAAGFATIPFTSPAAQGYNETYDFGFFQPVAIGNQIWNDTNNDGLLNNGETGINGVNVQLFLVGQIPGTDTPVATTTTATVGPDAGVFAFAGLAPGSYFLHIPTPPASATMSSTTTVTLDNGVNNDDNGSQPGGVGTAVTGPVIVLAPGETDNSVDFGFLAPAQLSGQVREDVDGDGSLADPDSGITGVTITLFTDPNGDGDPVDGVEVGTTTTNGTGNYAFTNLVPGNYTVVQTNLPGYTSTADKTSPNDERIPVTLAAGDNSTGNDFLDTRPANIYGQVRYDIDGDGALVETPADAGIPTVTVRLFTDPNGDGNPIDGVVVRTTTTDGSGNYEFLNVLPGLYVVNETTPVGYTSTADVAAPNNDLIPVVLLSASNSTGNDFLDTQPAGISGQVREDTNGDGNMLDPDTGIDLVTITLWSDPNGDGDPSDGSVVDTTTTDGSGNYSFPVVSPGNYVVVETNLPGYTSTNDVTSPNNDRVTVVLLAGGNSTGNDFIDTRPANISGQVRNDLDADGNLLDPDLPIPSVTVKLFTDPNGDGDPADGTEVASTSTDGSGNYQFLNRAPGKYVVVETDPSGFTSTADIISANDNRVPVVLLSGTNSTGNDFLDTDPPNIRGQVRLDTDGDGNLADSDSGIDSVTVELFADPDGDGVPDGVALRTTTTNGTGNYEFLNVTPGKYVVVETDPSGLTSTADISAPNDNRIPVVLVSEVDSNGNDFLDTDTVPVDISGQVRYDADGDGDLLDTDAPIPGVTVNLYSDPNGDGDPTDGTIIDFRVTDSNGEYLFEDVPPGSYVLVEVDPAGKSSTNDVAGATPPEQTDNRIPVVVTKFDITGRDFLDTCPSTWADYQNFHPTSANPSSNVDGDTSDSLSEYAFETPPESGAGNPFCIGPSQVTIGTFAGGFTRPKRATQNVTYTLEYTATLGNPTVWSSIPISSLTSPAITITDNGDCTETIVLDNLEAITGLINGKGFVRIRAELDEDNDSDFEHTSWTEVKGWKESNIEACGLTYNNPFQRCPVFSGTVDTTNGVTGQTLNLTNSAGAVDLGSLLTPAGGWYIEVIAGDNEGHRFDVVSASGSTLVLANDTNLDSDQAPFNTLLGAPPASLAGDKIELRRHFTLKELCPAAAFGSSNDPTSGDILQIFAGGVYNNYGLYTNHGNPIWVREGDDTLSDGGTAIVAPGQGIFVNGHQESYNTSIVAYGEVRANKFIRPLSSNFNLVGGGYPVDESAAKRAMNTSVTPPGNGFTSNTNYVLADQFLVWKKDFNINDSGYQNYYLFKSGSIERWVMAGGGNLTDRKNEILFLGNRATFYNMKAARPLFTMPSPWIP